MKIKNIAHIPALSVIAFLIMLTIGSGCKKLVEVGPPVTSVNEDNVYNNNTTAAAVLTGIYATLNNDHQNFTSMLSFATGLTGDELVLLDADYKDFFSLSINALRQEIENPSADFWSFLYSVIFTTNAAIEGLTKSTALTPAVKQQLLGEAKFMRAFCYFNLLNLYGEVPLALTTDYKINSALPRSSEAIVYQQMITDLKEASALLANDYVSADAVSSTGTTERVRPNKWVAMALLAKVYLYSGDYPNAVNQATEVIENKAFQLEPLDKTFLKTSKEIIWALQTVTMDNREGANTKEGYIYLSPVSNIPLNLLLKLNTKFVQQFVPADQRAAHWIGIYSKGGEPYFYPFKYKAGIDVTESREYPVLLRLGELYLIRAEANIRRDKISDGIADLNKLRTRATDLTAAPENQLPQLPLNAGKDQAARMLEYERMAEMFTEMGNRWFDLKRTPGFTDKTTTRADEVLAPLKGSNWKSWAKLFPIPLKDILANPSLRHMQNPGYN